MNNLDRWFKFLSSVASLTFAGLAVYTDQTTEYLLASILVYMWGRYD